MSKRVKNRRIKNGGMWGKQVRREARRREEKNAGDKRKEQDNEKHSN